MTTPLVRVLRRAVSSLCAAWCLPPLLVLALSACGGGGSASDAGVAPPPTAVLRPYTLAVSDDPIQASVTLDTARAIRQHVPLEGGTITATGADGSTYSLQIPADALTEPATITVTPVAQIADLPLGETGKTALGVQFEPSGLRFFKPATLVVTPSAAAAIPVARQLFVQWEGAGQKLALAAPDPVSDQIRLRVLHFSGMGVVRSKGFDADLAPVRARLGGDAEARIASAGAELLMRARQRMLQGGEDAESPLLASQLAELDAQFEREVTTVRVAAAGSSCAAGRAAFQTLLAVARQKELRGIDSQSESDRVTAVIPLIAEQCMKEEFEICRDEHVVTRIAPARLELERLDQLLGEGNGAFASTDRYVLGCLKFELDLRSTARVSGEPLDTVEEDVEVTRLRIGAESFEALLATGLQGQGPLVSRDYRVTPTQACFSVSDLTRVGATFSVNHLGFVRREGGEDLQDFALHYLPGFTASHYRQTEHCSDPPDTNTINGVSWTTIHFATVDGVLPLEPPRGLLLKGWTLQAGEVMARKTLRTQRIEAGVTTLSEDVYTLRHTPSL